MHHQAAHISALLDLQSLAVRRSIAGSSQGRGGRSDQRLPASFLSLLVLLPPHTSPTTSFQQKNLDPLCCLSSTHRASLVMPTQRHQHQPGSAFFRVCVPTPWVLASELTPALAEPHPLLKGLSVSSMGLLPQASVFSNFNLFLSLQGWQLLCAVLTSVIVCCSPFAFPFTWTILTFVNHCCDFCLLTIYGLMQGVIFQIEIWPYYSFA